MQIAANYKIMKNAEKALCLVILLVLVFACDHSDPVDPEVRIQRLNFHLEAKVHGESIVQQGNLKLNVPAASSCNIGESVIVAIFAEKECQALNGNCKLPYGQIDFINPSTGCYMTGKFNGSLRNDSEKCFIEATINIDYGVGLFKANGGTLNLTIVGTAVADQQMNYVIEIDGILAKTGFPK